VPPGPRTFKPHFRRGIYGFHAKKSRPRESRHQIMRKMDVRFDLMAEIQIELAK